MTSLLFQFSLVCVKSDDTSDTESSESPPEKMHLLRPRAAAPDQFASTPLATDATPALCGSVGCCTSRCGGGGGGGVRRSRGSFTGRLSTLADGY